MYYRSPIEQSAGQYLKGQIVITNINQFTKNKNTPVQSYHTTKGAFMFPLTGSCDIYFDDQCFPASYGTLVHGCPGKELRFHVISDEPFTHINLYYNTSSELTFRHSLKEPDAFYPILNRLLAHSSFPKQAKLAEQNYLLARLFSALYTDYITPDAWTNYELVEEAAAYIQEHYMHDLSLEFLSQTFGKTSNQLSYLFYKHLGKRPIQYLISCRMAAACDLLAQSVSPVYEIADRVGYKDPLFFSRLFKKHMGCSPGQFRSLYGGSYNRHLSNQDSPLL
ncbi:MAG: helix-turn-helix domain-containing protein [Lachnospiraceae bacterium]